MKTKIVLALTILALLAATAAFTWQNAAKDKKTSVIAKGGCSKDKDDDKDSGKGCGKDKKAAA